MNISEERPEEHVMHLLAAKAREALNASTMHAGHEEHEAGEEPADASRVMTAKTVTMVTLCLVSICMGIIPMQIAKCFKLVSSNQVVNPRYVVLCLVVENVSGISHGKGVDNMILYKLFKKKIGYNVTVY